MTCPRLSPVQTIKSIAYATSADGNPQSRTEDGLLASYTVPGNGLNQIGGRTNPKRSITVVGSVTLGTTVAINGTPEAVAPDGVFLRILGNLGNGAAWVPLTIRATIAGGGDAGRDAVEQSALHAWLPPFSETLRYNKDGCRSHDARSYYQWDCTNQLRRITARQTVPNENVNSRVEIDYDCFGRRFCKRVFQGDNLHREFHFVHHRWQLLYEVEQDGNGNTVAIRSYAWGPDISGTIDGAAGIDGLMEIRETKNGVTTRSIPLTDGKSVTGLVDAGTGEKVATYEYGPFGELLSARGQRAETCPLLYCHKYYDKETGFYYFGHRYYDPETRAWLSRDPLGEAGGVNLYAFCNNDPANSIDPDGLFVYSGESILDLNPYYSSLRKNISTYNSILERRGDLLSGKFKTSYPRLALQSMNGRLESLMEEIQNDASQINDFHTYDSDCDGIISGIEADQYGHDTVSTEPDFSPLDLVGAGRSLARGFAVDAAKASRIAAKEAITLEVVIGRSSKWAGKRRFNAVSLTADEVERATLKSIRRKSGASGNSAGQIITTADELEFILTKVTFWQRNVLAADPLLTSLSDRLKGTLLHSSVSRQIGGLNVGNLAVNERLYSPFHAPGTSAHLSPATGKPYTYRIPDYRLALDTILDIKPRGTPLSGPQVDDFMEFGNTSDVRFIFYELW